MVVTARHGGSRVIVTLESLVGSGGVALVARRERTRGSRARRPGREARESQQQIKICEAAKLQHRRSGLTGRRHGRRKRTRAEGGEVKLASGTVPRVEINKRGECRLASRETSAIDCVKE